MRHETFEQSTPGLAGRGREPFVLGHRADGTAVTFDIWKLTGPHIFIQGGTGSGKSTTAVGIVDGVLGQGAAVTIIDPEGQYGALCKTWPDMIVIGGEKADVPLNVETIGAVVAEAYRGRTSFVVQLHEVETLAERQKISAELLRGIMEMPREYNAKRLVVVDEVHLIAPQKGFSEAAFPLAEVAARGRRRGCVLLLITQRFARVDKDTISQCMNVLVGANKIGADLSAVCDALGLTGKEARVLHKLRRGTFLATGPDFGDEMSEFRVATPRTKLDGDAEYDDDAAWQAVPRALALKAMRQAAAREGTAAKALDSPDETAGAGGMPEGEGQVAMGGDLSRAILSTLAVARTTAVPVAAILLLLRSRASANAVKAAIAELRRAGLTVGRHRLALSGAGREQVGGRRAQTGIIETRLGELRRSAHPEARRVLDALAAAVTPLPMDEIARRTGFAPRSRKLRQHLDWLSRQGLVRKRSDEFAASDGYVALASL